MSIEERGGYKVDKNLLTDKAVDTTAFILSWSRKPADSVEYKTSNVSISRPSVSAHTPSVKRKYMDNLRDTLWRLMDDSSRGSAYTGAKDASKSYKLALTTKYDYLGDIRESVNKRLQVKHSKLEEIVNRLIDKHPKYKNKLNALLTCKAEDVHLKLRNIKTSLNKSSRDGRVLHIELSKVKAMNEFIAMLKPTDTDIELRSDTMKEKRTTRKRNAKLLNWGQVEGVMSHGLRSDNIYELAVGVALATGRRFIEVMHTGVFSLSDQGTGFFEVSGIAKKIDKDSRFEVHTLPCIVDSKLIIEATSKLRSHSVYLNWLESLKGLGYKDTNKGINNRAARGASEVFNTMMTYAPKTLVFKDTRSIAGLVAEKSLYPKNHSLWEGYDKDEFKTYYLIHDNLEEAVNYGHINLSFEDSHEIEQYTPPKSTTNKSRGTIVKHANITALESLEILGDKPLLKVHNHVVRVMVENAFKLSASLIYKGKVIDGERIKFGGSMPVIKRYLADEEVDKALVKFYKDNDIE